MYILRYFSSQNLSHHETFTFEHKPIIYANFICSYQANRRSPLTDINILLHQHVKDVSPSLSQLLALGSLRDVHRPLNTSRSYTPSSYRNKGSAEEGVWTDPPANLNLLSSCRASSFEVSSWSFCIVSIHIGRNWTVFMTSNSLEIPWLPTGINDLLIISARCCGQQCRRQGL